LSEPLQQKLHPKCANPACSAAFQPLGAGRFFRFLPESVEDGSGAERIGQPGAARVKHLWLCEHCSSVMRLSFDSDRGVVFGLRWPELPSGSNGEVPAREFEGDALLGSSPAPGETRD